MLKWFNDLCDLIYVDGYMKRHVISWSRFLQSSLEEIFVLSFQSLWTNRGSLSCCRGTVATKKRNIFRILNLKTLIYFKKEKLN